MMSYRYGQPPPEIEKMVSLKVDNLSYRTTPDDLNIVFEKYGEVGDVYIPRDRDTRESRGFAFVRFYDRRDAEDAIDSLDGSLLDGRKIRVQLARYGRPDSPQRDRRGDGGERSRRSRSRSRSRRGGSRSRRRSGSRTRRHTRSGSQTPPRRNRNRRSKSSSPAKSRSKSPVRGNERRGRSASNSS